MARKEREEDRRERRASRSGDSVTGHDAAYIEPKFVEDDELLPRDNSGGPGFTPYTAQFGDGGRVTGPKASLSARKGG